MHKTSRPVLPREREHTKGTKESWGDGPWVQEPDEDRWTSVDTKFECHAKRNEMGSWCGYVTVSASHPWFGRSVDSIDADVTVHGGVTYAEINADSHCSVLVIGFDCSHAFDLSPKMESQFGSIGRGGGRGIYRDLDYVKEQCEQLARQAHYALLASNADPETQRAAQAADEIDENWEAGYVLLVEEAKRRRGG